MTTENEHTIYDRYYHDSRLRRKSNAPKGVHIPCKKESKTLRKLKKETGLSEKELREIPKYRKELSESSQRVIDRINKQKNEK
jgi:hypothetical protein